jgi:DNA-binding response OmpR family regulator
MFYAVSPRLCVPSLARRVLVVEDDLACRFALDRLLTFGGFQTLVAATFASACEQLAFQPDIVLTDLMLPDGCGLELVRRIRRRDETALVAVLTAGNDALVAEALALEPDALFRKPFDANALLAWLDDPRPRRR